MIREGINLSDIIDAKSIYQEPDFEYAGIKGFAELIGWKIIFFKIIKESSFVDAIRLYDIEDESEVNMCNYILKKLECPINFNTSMSEIYTLLGKEISKENYLINCVKYSYRLKNDMYISLDISDKKIMGMEIVLNKQIIDNILS